MFANADRPPGAVVDGSNQSLKLTIMKSVAAKVTGNTNPPDNSVVFVEPLQLSTDDTPYQLRSGKLAALAAGFVVDVL